MCSRRAKTHHCPRRLLNAATAHFPAVVLGAEAASLLGAENLANPTEVWIGGHWFTVVGILKPVQLVSQTDSMAFIGFPIAQQYFGFDGHPSELFLRTVPSQVTAVASVLDATVDPANPSTVAWNLPSDILKAEVAAKGAYNGLFLALGAVALLVGGVGIANVMVISVLERRSEIGLRRALGASRRHVAEQFLIEAVLIAAIGGVAGTLIGLAATAIYRGARIGRCKFLRWPSMVALAPPLSSVASPVCTRRCGRPGCRRRRRCAQYKLPRVVACVRHTGRGCGRVRCQPKRLLCQRFAREPDPAVLIFRSVNRPFELAECLPWTAWQRLRDCSRRRVKAEKRSARSAHRSDGVESSGRRRGR